MTGYGAGRADAPTARVTVEIRSVNQRFLDVRIVAPREYAAWEREMRDRVRAVAQRGRVEVSVARAAVAARRRPSGAGCRARSRRSAARSRSAWRAWWAGRSWIAGGWHRRSPCSPTAAT